MLVGRVIDGWGWVNGEGRKETEKCVLVGSGRWGEESGTALCVSHRTGKSNGE